MNNTDQNNFQPRLGFSYDFTGSGDTILRGGYGIYYDQPLMGIFLQNAFVNPPVNQNPQVLNARLSNPGAGAVLVSVRGMALVMRVRWDMVDARGIGDGRRCEREDGAVGNQSIRGSGRCEMPFACS